MTDDELIARFEDGTLAGDELHHAEHVQLAWAYLARHDFATGLGRFIAHLKAFAARMGKADRYHETITCAWFALIHERDRAQGGFDSWDMFAGANADLVTQPTLVLESYYRAETLASPLARRVFVLPDRGLETRSIATHKDVHLEWLPRPNAFALNTEQLEEPGSHPDCVV